MALKTSNKNRKKVVEPVVEQVVEQPVVESIPEVAPAKEDTNSVNSLVVLSIGVIAVILLAFSYFL